MNQQEPGSSEETPQGGPILPPHQFVGPVFGPEFYASVLRDRVVSECHGEPGKVPVVNLHLANGRVLDLCHITYLSDRWLGLQYFRDSETCGDMDLAFLPYELVTMVTVSIHHPQERRLGFSIDGPAGSSADS